MRAVWLEHRRGAPALGIGESSPTISWSLDAEPGAAILDLSFTRSSGAVERASVPARDVRSAWPFAPLGSRDRGRLEVRVRVDTGQPGAACALDVEAGLLDPADWVEPFVSASVEAPVGAPRPAHLMRAEFELDDPGTIAAVRIHSTAHGVYELELDGRPVADSLLEPGWSSYSTRLRYRTHDITARLRSGPNVLGAWLADGWYRGRIGFDGGLWDLYGRDLSLLLQLEVARVDGRVEIVPLADRWRSHVAPITATGWYEGETHDSRLHPAGWSEPGFDDSAWAPVTPLERSMFTAALEAPTGPPVAVTEQLRPVTVAVRDAGRIRLDFGQNIAGRLRIRVAGPSGHVVRLHHAEVLESDELAVRPLRSAVSIDTFVCDGSGPQEWSPRFTTHGFRFAEVEGWPGGLETLDVVAEVVHTDMERTGWFESSHEGLNRLHENVVWSMRGNFIDIPTDCPQRDERMGWTGDIQVFAPAAAFLYACHGTLAGWLRDLASEQAEQGFPPVFVPWVPCGFGNHPTAAWGDAAVLVPWELYRHSGDPAFLERSYVSMCAWVDLVHSLTGGTGLWNTGVQLGDWLDPAAPPDSPGDSPTDEYLVATAYHVRTARVLAEAAAILGKDADAARYTEVARRALNAFRAEYVSADGRVLNDTSTALSLAIVFDLLADDDERARAGARLVELVRANGYRISTGFVGTPIICDAIVASGDVETAYRLLLEDGCPSWLYPVSMGATTIWERWDSMLPDGTINPGDMTSFNHYALGAVADFLHRVVAGLAPAAPGYRKLLIQPRPGGGLSRASASHESPAGPASSRWWRDGEVFRLEVLVPPGCTATVVLPVGGERHEVGSGRHSFACPFPVAETT